MLLNRILNKLVLVCSFVAITATAQTPYEEGQKALREARWMAAADHFDKVSDSSDVADDSDQAAAMYWRAHALYKADHRGDAARQIHQLERKYPGSEWLNEAKALQIEYQGSIDDASQEDELRLFALSQLLERDFNRALPLVIEIMNNSASDSVREDAMFLLGMSDSPEAQRAIADIVSDSSRPDLQAHAVSILAIAGDDTSLVLLDGLYTESASIEIKQAVMHAYLNADQPAPLVEILQWEKDPEMQRDLIYALGAMEATSELHALYPTLTTLETRRAAVEAFAVAGDQQMLMQILESETDAELRATAIQGIAIEDGDGAVEFVESMYFKASTREEKMAILESLVIMDGAGNLAREVAQNENDPELKRLAIQIMGMIGSTDHLSDYYNQTEDLETRQSLLEAMAVAGDTTGIRKILETEQDPELKVVAIHALAINSDNGTASLLAGIYAGGSRVEKTAVIESMMMLNDAPALIGLISQESDPELKRQMMEMLTVMDSDEATEFLFQMLESKG